MSFFRKAIPTGAYGWTIITRAQDGDPVEIWDGSTYGPDGATASKSSSAQITVVGPGTPYPIGFTLQELSRFYWLPRWDDIQIDSSETDIEATASGTTVSLSTFSPCAGSQTFGFLYPLLPTGGGYLVEFPITSPIQLTVGLYGQASMSDGQTTMTGIYNPYNGDLPTTREEVRPFSLNPSISQYEPDGIFELTKYVGVGISFTFSPSRDSTCLIKGSDGSPDLYYPALSINVGASAYNESDGSDGSDFCFCSADSSYTPNSTVLAPDGSPLTRTSNPISFTLESVNGIKIIDNFPLPGFVATSGGAASASGSSVKLILQTPEWNYEDYP
jgi:hypothetical protein